MKEYYYLKGKDQLGPFSTDQLSDKGLTSETLVWTEGMESWQKLKDVSDLYVLLKPKATPPPPPTDLLSKTEVSGEIKVVTDKQPNATLEALKPSRQVLTWFIAWCAFHLFALLMSYSRIEIFNDSGKPQADAFWPFVDFLRKKYPGGVYPWMLKEGQHAYELMEEKVFNGIFVDYDWTEFAFYVGIALIIYVLYRVANNDNETQTVK